ncbi:hyoscyamine 6-dioxygenase-like [Populus alba x Populus x berolinensis]|uniref:Hyoscyamine 6-dioxygenase-like n=2 Tax=Populus alba x Populus x berolinensis TaxID=444605 RepID=A0AAD6W3S0_9ROSI|nr:hyoscyamine 6-dioxygenase-like [Populus alba x Populus x berolinensis]
MEKLISNYNQVQIKSLPEKYIFPPEKRPGKLPVSACKFVPVIDLDEAAGDNRAAISQKILKASQEFGFFQVVNHGVPEDLMKDTMRMFKEFFELPAEDKAIFYTEDARSKKHCKLYPSSLIYATEDIHLWRDNLKHDCHPLEKCILDWPVKPTRYRQVVGSYAAEVTKLAPRILELVCEGLGLESGYFEGKLGEVTTLSVNHYPPCPDPSLALGLSKHCDPNLITILLQDDVCGLQIFKDNEWIGVEPVPNAFVVNIGYQLQIMSNNKLKSVEHRAVTNSRTARTSAAFFFNPSDDIMIEPAKALVNASNPQVFRAFQYIEFLRNYITRNGSDDDALEHFKLRA